MPRFIEVRSEKREYLIVDTKSIPHRVICTCSGYDAPHNSEQIIQALEEFHKTLYAKLSIGVSTHG